MRNIYAAPEPPSAKDRKVSNGGDILDRVWYYILDFNDRDNNNTWDHFVGTPLRETETKKIYQFFKMAVELDLKNKL